jgi:3-oxoacyl-[acyl-carrier-protein] synthase II
MSRRVAITGLGAVTPVGNSARATWDALVEGRSGIGEITTFPAHSLPVHIAGLVKDFDERSYLPHASLRRHLSRGAKFGVAAFLQALGDAGPGLQEYYAPAERGIAVGCGVCWPDVQSIADMFDTIVASNRQRYPAYAPRDVLIQSHNAGMAVMSQIGNCQGPLISISMACAASSYALGEALRRLQEGEVRVIIAGGYDAMTSLIDVLGFSLVGALTTDFAAEPQRASRPFDRQRSGFVLGEGAVMMVLEDWESARERGATIYAELAGYGSSMNAYRITDSPPDGDGAIQAIERALQDAGLEPQDIDYVAAHGTSTPGNDLSETVALKAVFGEHAYRLAISSPKSMTGHLTSAAGALNLLVAIYALREQRVPPTINYEHPDPRLDLDYVPVHSRARRVRAAMANAFAFGGTNAVLIAREARSYHR